MPCPLLSTGASLSCPIECKGNWYRSPGSISSLRTSVALLHQGTRMATSELVLRGPHTSARQLSVPPPPVEHQSTTRSTRPRLPDAMLRGQAPRPAHHRVPPRRPGGRPSPQNAAPPTSPVPQVKARRRGQNRTNRQETSHTKGHHAHANEALTDRPPAPATGRPARQRLTRSDATAVPGPLERSRRA